MKKRKYWEQRIFRISAAFLLLGLTAQTNLDEPFGLRTVIASKGPLPANWEDLQSQINMEQAVVCQIRRGGYSGSTQDDNKFFANYSQREKHKWIYLYRKHQSSIQVARQCAHQSKKTKLTAA